MKIVITYLVKQMGSYIEFVSLSDTLLIHILILINYIVAYRTSNLGISKHSIEDGGMTLN